MVMAGKGFKIAESTSLSDIADKLKGFKTEEDYGEGEYKFTLVTEIMNLTPRKTGSQAFISTTTPENLKGFHTRNPEYTRDASLPYST